MSKKKNKSVSDKHKQNKHVIAYKALKPNYNSNFGNPYTDDRRYEGFHYEIGKSYRSEPPIEFCNTGFHGCTRPLDVNYFYYPSFSRFFISQHSGDFRNNDKKTKRRAGDSKVVSSKITLKKELTLEQFVKAASAWCRRNNDALPVCKKFTGTGEPKSAYRKLPVYLYYGDTASSAISVNRQLSVAVSAATCGLVETKNNNSLAIAMRRRSIAWAHSDFSAALAVNTGSVAVTINYNSLAAVTQELSRAVTTASTSIAVSVSDHATAVETYCHWSIAASVSVKSSAVAHGDMSIAAATRGRTAVTCKGKRSIAVSVGAESSVTAGAHGVAIACTVEGYHNGLHETIPGYARAAKGGAILLLEFNASNDLINGKFLRIGDKCTDLKPNVYYTLKDGEIIADENRANDSSVGCIAYGGAEFPYVQYQSPIVHNEAEENF